MHSSGSPEVKVSGRLDGFPRLCKGFGKAKVTLYPDLDLARSERESAKQTPDSDGTSEPHCLTINDPIDGFVSGGGAHAAIGNFARHRVVLRNDSTPGKRKSPLCSKSYH